MLVSAIRAQGEEHFRDFLISFKKNTNNFYDLNKRFIKSSLPYTEDTELSNRELMNNAILTFSQVEFIEDLAFNPLCTREMAAYAAPFLLSYITFWDAPKEAYSIFLCGPQAMYNFVDKEIETLLLRRKFIRHELFGEYRNPQNDAEYPGVSKEIFEVTIHVCGETKKVTVSANDTLLVGLEKAGISVPAHCRSGECGWCHAQLIKGNVYMPKAVEHRRLADIQYGYIQPFCAFAISDLEIEVSVKA